MKPSIDLFELVKSLSVSEKRYFKMYATLQEGNKTYLRLFNEIEKQKTYDENKIKEKFREEKFINQLSFTKNYLYKLIFKSLVNYKHESSVDSKISEMILRCKILFEKSLYRQYFKMLNSTKELALKYERYGYLVQLLDMEKHIKKKDEIKKISFDESYNAAMEAVELIKNNFEYSKLLSYTFNIARDKGKVRNSVQSAELDKIMNFEYIKNRDNILTVKSEETYFHIISLLEEIRGNYKLKLGYLRKRYETVIKNPKPFEDSILNYKADILNDIIMVNIKLSRFEDAECYLEKFKQLYINASSDESAVLVPAHAQLLIYTNKKEFENLNTVINTLESALIEYKDKIDISLELQIHFNILKAHMLSGDYNSALYKMNYFLSHPLLSVREDLECFARIINLIIHFELNNLLLLEHLIISTYRYLYKRKKIYNIETLLLNFLRKTTSITNESELAEHLDLLRYSLIRLKSDSFEKNAFEYFDFISWIQDKISKFQR
jgi:hypothetical protein